VIPVVRLFVVILSFNNNILLLKAEMCNVQIIYNFPTLPLTLSLYAELPPLGDLRLALLGPRVRRTLYRQDRASSQADKNTRTTSTNRERHQSDFPTRLQCPHRRGSVDNSVTSNVYEMENRLQRIFDVTNKEYSRSLPKDIGSSRSWHSHRRNAPFCVAQLKLTQRLSHVVRQPKGPDGSKGFSLPRKSTQFQL